MKIEDLVKEAEKRELFDNIWDYVDHQVKSHIKANIDNISDYHVKKGLEYSLDLDFSIDNIDDDSLLIILNEKINDLKEKIVERMYW